MSVIPRANALALQGYRHCCHVMLHSPVEEKLFGFYPVKHAVLVSNQYNTCLVLKIWRFAGSRRHDIKAGTICVFVIEYC